MGNPKPTKSKPIKIGRKHTRADSTRTRERKRRGHQINQRLKIESHRKYKALVAAYWRGEIDQHPTKGVL